MPAMIERLKRYGEIAAALAACGAILAAIVGVTGGSLPPWPSIALAQSLQLQVKQNQLSLTLLQRDYYQTQLNAAQADLAKHPDSTAAGAQVQSLQWKLRIIDSQLTAATAPATPPG
jgi:hypothetical protein